MVHHFTLAIRFGLLVALIRMALGFLMTVPTADQLQTIESGAISLAGAHSVGVADGGPGLPVTAWSTTGGDLRVPHFVGMHALQALPLLAWLLTLTRLGLDEHARSRLVTTGAACYLGLVGLLLWQALRGQPLIVPEGWTLGAATALFVAVAAAVAAIPYLEQNSTLPTSPVGRKRPCRVWAPASPDPSPQRSSPRCIYGGAVIR